MKNYLRKIMLITLVMAAVLTACAVPGTDEPVPGVATPNPKPTDAPAVEFDSNDPLVGIKKYLYEQYSILPGDVRLVEQQEREWSDSCLGLGRPDEICMQVITPGFIVTVETPRGTVVFHTASSLSAFRMESSLGSPQSGRFDAMARFRWLVAGRLNIPFDQVQIASSEAVEWPSACLGVEEPGIMCASVITPGYRITLSTPQGDVVIHANQDLSIYRTPQPLPGEDRPLLIWDRSGGIAGICEHLVIYFDGAYQLTDCRSEMVMFAGTLDIVSYEQLISKVVSFGPTTWKFEAPTGSADMFMDSYTFNGFGGDLADDQEMELLNEFFNSLVIVVKSQPTTK